MLREAGKGVTCLGKDKEQCQEMGQEGQQVLGYGVGVAAEGLGQAGM